MSTQHNSRDLLRIIQRIWLYLVAVIGVPLLGLGALGLGLALLMSSGRDTVRVLGLVMFLFGAGLLASAVGLFFRRKWGLYLYLVSMAGDVITNMVSQREATKVYIGWQEFATPWSTVIGGSLVAILLLTLPVLPVASLLKTGHEIQQASQDLSNLT